MAELNNTIVKGKLNVTEDIEASNIKVTTIKGATMTAPLSWKDDSALPSKSLSYVLGIDAFASGGQTGWQSKSDFLGTDVVKTTANQGLTDTQRSNARTNIGAGTGVGSVTSVQVQASDCITSTQSTAQTSTLNTTIKHNEILGTAKTQAVYSIAIDKYGHITAATAYTVYQGAASDTNNITTNTYDGSISS